MVEIGGRPVLWHIMSIYARFGYRDFVLPLGYKGEVIKQYFHDYRSRNADFTVELKTGDITVHPCPMEDWRVTLCDTGQETLKGGRLKRVARYIEGDRFMVTYGDGVADIDIDRLLEFHKKSGTIGTFTAFSSLSAPFSTISPRTRAATWKRNPSSDWRRKGSFPCIRTPANGSAWIPCATPSTSTGSGTAARPSGPEPDAPSTGTALQTRMHHVR